MAIAAQGSGAHSHESLDKNASHTSTAAYSSCSSFLGATMIVGQGAKDKSSIVRSGNASVYNQKSAVYNFC